MASPLSSPPISTSSSSTATGRPASSSPATAPWTSGSASSTIPSWATAPWTDWPTPATRSSSKAPATGNGYRHTAPCWTKGVIDQPTATRYLPIIALPGPVNDREYGCAKTLNNDTLPLRISVELVLSLLTQGVSPEAILDDYPGVELHDIRACTAYAQAVIAGDTLAAVSVAES